MSGLKSCVKKLAVANQTRKYKSALKTKNLDYNAWVIQLENNQKEDFLINDRNQKCLKNDFRNFLNESLSDRNDENLAKSIRLCQQIDFIYDENGENCQTQYLVCDPILLPQVNQYVKKPDNSVDCVIFKISDGNLSKFALREISEIFHRNKNLIMIYSDEDVMLPDGKREKPWFKPDWAPDEFLSFFYFGGMVTVNASKLKKLQCSGSDDIYSYLYKLLLLEGAFRKHELYDRNLANDRVIHVPKILYHSFAPSYDVVRDMKLRSVIRERIGRAKVSVIIPSKDHPEILFRCIDSLIERTDTHDEFDYELIVVDNGSNEVNKTTIEGILNSYNATYIYEKSDFNFSYMCNLGASNASGDYLLFLNDDMEITEPDWMHKMLQKAALPYAGAVGAKLIYPDSDMIQHAGITNLRIGPAHKLQFLSDTEDHYFGRNRYVHDMMGVTGACLMVKRAVFDEAGGFDEDLKVAFNDVDLCYKIFEKGYYNIVRCDTRLYHHESLSRGNDSDSDDKMQRMNREKDYLYEKHQWIYGRDPFYNINLTTDMWEYEYAPKYHYEVHLERDWARVSEITDDIKMASEDRCVRIGMECAMDIFKWKYGVEKGRIDMPASDDDMGYYLQGYTFVTGSNNACFERTLFLENTASGRCYGVETESEFRPDIAGNVPDQLNVDLAGYTAKIRSDSLPKGHYRFGMYMKDRTSRLRLYNMSNWTLDIS